MKYQFIISYQTLVFILYWCLEENTQLNSTSLVATTLLSYQFQLSNPVLVAYDLNQSYNYPDYWL